MIRQLVRIPLRFGLSPAPRIFTKLLEVPLSILRNLNIRIIIYLEDMLLLGKIFQEILTAKEIVISLLQHLGFFMNLKKSVINPTQISNFQT